MGNFLVHILSGNNGSKINEVLPTELLKKILENLDFKSLGSAKQSCKHWKEIIDVFELKKKALSKFCDLTGARLILLQFLFFLIFRKDFMYNHC